LTNLRGKRRRRGRICRTSQLSARTSKQFGRKRCGVHEVFHNISSTLDLQIFECRREIRLAPLAHTSGCSESEPPTWPECPRSERNCENPKCVGERIDSGISRLESSDSHLGFKWTHKPCMKNHQSIQDFTRRSIIIIQFGFPCAILFEVQFATKHLLCSWFLSRAGSRQAIASLAVDQWGSVKCVCVGVICIYQASLLSACLSSTETQKSTVRVDLLPSQECTVNPHDFEAIPTTQCVLCTLCQLRIHYRIPGMLLRV
jgi:hypothetical protein